MNDTVKTYKAPRATRIELRNMRADHLLKLFEQAVHDAALRCCAPSSIEPLRKEVARRLDRAVDNVNG